MPGKFLFGLKQFLSRRSPLVSIYDLVRHGSGSLSRVFDLKMAVLRWRFCIAKNSNSTRQSKINVVRRNMAVESDKLMPVNSAMYDAKQTGHLGMSARTAPGNNQAEIARIFRAQLGVF